MSLGPSTRPALPSKEEEEDTCDEPDEDDSLPLDGRSKMLAIRKELLLVCCSLSSDNVFSLSLLFNNRLRELSEGTFSLLQMLSCTRRSRISHE